MPIASGSAYAIAWVVCAVWASRFDLGVAELGLSFGDFLLVTAWLVAPSSALILIGLRIGRQVGTVRRPTLAAGYATVVWAILVAIVWQRFPPLRFVVVAPLVGVTTGAALGIATAAATGTARAATHAPTDGRLSNASGPDIAAGLMGFVAMISALATAGLALAGVWWDAERVATGRQSLLIPPVPVRLVDPVGVADELFSLPTWMELRLTEETCFVAIGDRSGVVNLWGPNGGEFKANWRVPADQLTGRPCRYFPLDGVVIDVVTEPVEVPSTTAPGGSTTSTGG